MINNIEEGGLITLKGCTRVTVVTTESGRIYENRDDDNVVKISLQDDGKTLKVFILQETVTERLKKEIKILNEMTNPAKNNICGLDAIREQQSIVDSLIDEIK